MTITLSPMSLPAFFYPLLWSYDVRRIDVERDRKTIIVQAINYGDMEHWRWLVTTYGKEGVLDVLRALPATDLRPRVRRLVMLIFGIESFAYASRSAH